MPEKSSSRVLPVVLLVVGLVLGVLIGYMGFRLLGGSASGLVVPDKGRITEDQLDKPIASFTYNGKKTKITAREVMSELGDISKQKGQDGTYRMPPAETTLAYARNSIMLAEVASRGIEVSDAEMKEYLQKYVGVDDVTSMAQQFNMSEEQATKIVKESAAMEKLRMSIVGTSPEQSAPQPPIAPAADADQDAVTPEYATYIIGLLGDEWDASKGTWAREDGQFYQALKDQNFTAEGATYQTAQVAYFIASSKYQESANKLNEAWTNFLNEAFSKSNITIGNLVN